MRAVLAATAALTLLAACATAAAQQQQAQTPPCTTAEFRQLDFWVGTWDLYASADTTQAPIGVNVITREYGDCVIEEQFTGVSGLIGHSVSTYHAQAQTWRQTWVDNQGGYFALTGGPTGDGFMLNSTRLGDNSPYQRMIWEDITPNRFVWRWQSSTDAGATWTDTWVIHYVRRSQ
jgi:hypothetical protein